MTDEAAPDEGLFGLSALTLRRIIVQLKGWVIRRKALPVFFVGTYQEKDDRTPQLQHPPWVASVPHDIRALRGTLNATNGNKTVAPSAGKVWRLVSLNLTTNTLAANRTVDILVEREDGTAGSSSIVKWRRLGQQSMGSSDEWQWPTVVSSAFQNRDDSPTGVWIYPEGTQGVPTADALRITAAGLAGTEAVTLRGEIWEYDLAALVAAMGSAVTFA